MDSSSVPKHLLQLVRERIAANEIPCGVPAAIVSGRGVGKACAVCDEPIAADDYEYELRFREVDSEPVIFHRRCYLAWEIECISRSSPEPVTADD
jgi:hypothetical protein